MRLAPETLIIMCRLLKMFLNCSGVLLTKHSGLKLITCSIMLASYNTDDEWTPFSDYIFSTKLTTLELKMCIADFCITLNHRLFVSSE